MITYIDSKNCQKVCGLMRAIELLQAVRYEAAGEKIRVPDRESPRLSIDCRGGREGSVVVCIGGSARNGRRDAKEAVPQGAKVLVAAKEEQGRVGKILGPFPACQGVV